MIPGPCDPIDLFSYADDDNPAEQMRVAFETFDRQNPQVWDLFIRFANDALARGRKTLSASLIVERIRWEVYILTATDDEFKINNNFRAFYARKFIGAFPERGACFRTRRSMADAA